MARPLSIAVQHHPDRPDKLARLVAQLGDAPHRVVTDPDPAGRPSSMRTAALAWGAADRAADWHVVIADDMMLCDDFALHAAAALRSAPEARCLVAFFTFGHYGPHRAAVERARGLKLAWTRLPQIVAGRPERFVPIICAALPVEQALMFAAREPTAPDANVDDVQMARFALERRLRVWATVPSLAEHDDTRSILGFGRDDRALPARTGRRASWFARKPGAVDWGRY